MLRVVSGIPEKPSMSWVRGKADSFFDYNVDESWLKEDLIIEELKEVDGIVSIDGLMLTKENGRRIPINWISQGSKQFIMMTRKPNLFYNSRHFGSNVYEYFYRWAVYKNLDVNIVLNSPLCVGKKIKGLFLNTNEVFSSGTDLASLVLKYREGILHERGEDGIVYYEVAERRGDEGYLVGLGDFKQLSV